jgi:hypothetical protein
MLACREDVKIQAGHTASLQLIRRPLAVGRRAAGAGEHRPRDDEGAARPAAGPQVLLGAAQHAGKERRPQRVRRHQDLQQPSAACEQFLTGATQEGDDRGFAVCARSGADTVMLPGLTDM